MFYIIFFKQKHFLQKNYAEDYQIYNYVFLDNGKVILFLMYNNNYNDIVWIMKGNGIKKTFS